MKEIETARLIIRNFTSDDTNDLYEILGDAETMKNCEPAYDFEKIGGDTMNKGKVIVLNGVSSSGKTTLAKALQGTFDEPYIRLSIDDFISMMPEKLIKDDLGNTVYKSQTILLQTIKMLSDAGVNVIVDNIMLTYFQTLKQYISLLHDYPVLLVRVDCPLHELRRREAERGDRAVGQGERQINDLEPRELYDITVNTFINTTAECIELIKEELTVSDKSSVIKQLWLTENE